MWVVEREREREVAERLREVSTTIIIIQMHTHTKYVYITTSKLMYPPQPIHNIRKPSNYPTNNDTYLENYIVHMYMLSEFC
jgi:hypothetical protein